MKRWLIATVLGACTVASAQELRVHGYVFGDYWYKLQGDSLSLPAQYAPFPKAMQAFEFRRVYLYTDARLSERCSARLLLEANDSSLDAGRRYSFFVKEAWVRWQGLLPATELGLGILGTPTWRFSEDVWAYRSLEKTVLDFWELGNAVDFGAAVVATLGQRAPQLRLWAMLGNGSSVRAEGDRYKKLYGSALLQLPGGVAVELYGDWEPMGNARERTTAKVTVGYRAESAAVGVEAFGHESGTTHPAGMSAFGWIQLLGQPDLRLVARADWVDRDRRQQDAGERVVFGLFGVDYRPLPQLQLMPNLWWLRRVPKSAAESPTTMAVVRMSFFVRYP
ncbi:MAG: hypothetical protein RRA60_07780 [Chlorobiota bacterium]|nr:hypothetical protein [Chlorobiota bacterium]